MEGGQKERGIKMITWTPAEKRDQDYVGGQKERGADCQEYHQKKGPGGLRGAEG